MKERARKNFFDINSNITKEHVHISWNRTPVKHLTTLTSACKRPVCPQYVSPTTPTALIFTSHIWYPFDIQVHIIYPYCEMKGYLDCILDDGIGVQPENCDDWSNNQLKAWILEINTKGYGRWFVLPNIYYQRNNWGKYFDGQSFWE